MTRKYLSSVRKSPYSTLQGILCESIYCTKYVVNCSLPSIEEPWCQVPIKRMLASLLLLYSLTTGKIQVDLGPQSLRGVQGMYQVILFTYTAQLPAQNKFQLARISQKPTHVIAQLHDLLFTFVPTQIEQRRPNSAAAVRLRYCNNSLLRSRFQAIFCVGSQGPEELKQRPKRVYIGKSTYNISDRR